MRAHLERRRGRVGNRVVVAQRRGEMVPSTPSAEPAATGSVASARPAAPAIAAAERALEIRRISIANNTVPEASSRSNSAASRA